MKSVSDLVCVCFYTIYFYTIYFYNYLLFMTTNEGKMVGNKKGILFGLTKNIDVLIVLLH